MDPNPQGISCSRVSVAKRQLIVSISAMHEELDQLMPE